MRHFLVPALLALTLPCQDPHALLPNQGQWPAHVQAAVKHGALTTWLTDVGFTTRALVVDQAFDPRGREGPDAKLPTAVTATVDVDLVGAAPGTLAFAGRMPGIQAFFVGNDPAQWAPSVERFASTTRRDVWPGVDLVFGTRDGVLAYDLRFAPGAAAGAARFRVGGHERIRLGRGGVLELDLGIGTLSHGAPRAWQVGPDGARQPLEAAFVLDGDEVTFTVTGRDPALPLVIDPPLLWNAMIGGTGYEGPGYRRGVDRDPATGDLYVCGWTSSLSWGTQGVYDGFLRCHDAAGTLVWHALIGGTVTAEEWIKGCRFDGAGGVFFGGFSSAWNFPTSPGCLQPTNQGPLGSGSYGDMVVGRAVYVTTPSPQLTLPWSTFLGGLSGECLNSLVPVPGGVAVTGWTYSSQLPTHTTAAQPQLAGGCDGYVAVLDPSQTGPQQFVSGTYWGGTIDDVLSGIERDSAGLLVVGGSTQSTDFPTTVNAIQFGYQGGAADGTIVCFDPGLSVAPYSSYLGGTGSDTTYEIAIDATDRWVIGDSTEVGLAAPLTFPATAFQPQPNPGVYDGFVLLLDWQQAPAQQLVWGTYLGGDFQDGINGLAVDVAGRVTVTGSVETHVGSTVTNFPVTDWCLQPIPVGGPGGTTGHWDAFVARLDPRRTGDDQLVYSTFLGGNGFDLSNDLVLDERARPIVLGRTSSTSLHGVPSNGAEDIFLAQLDLLATVAERYGAPSSACAGAFLDGYHQQITGGFDLTLTVSGAPANAIGGLVFGFQDVLGTPLLGIASYLNPPTGFTSLLLLSGANGCADFRFQAMLVPPMGLAAQSVWLGGCAQFVASDAIRF